MSEAVPTKKYLKSLTAETKKRMTEMSAHYGLSESGIPERNWDKLSLVMTSKTFDEALDLSKRAYDSLFLCVLAMWGRREIPGPVTPESLEKKAKQAEGLARMLENKGDDDAARKQRKKAEGFLHEASQLREAR